MRSEFLELPQGIGEAVARSVKAFADTRRPPLQYHLWYHDQPLWLVWEKVSEFKGDAARAESIVMDKLGDAWKSAHGLPNEFTWTTPLHLT
jgi:hypothetical protein